MTKIKKLSVLCLLMIVLFCVYVYQGTAQVGNVVTLGHQYYVDATEADQGVSGNGKSIAAWLSAIGQTKRAELIFEHKAIGDNTTSYTITTAIDMTSYPHIQFSFKPGALLAGAGNVTFSSPRAIKAANHQQIYSGSGSMSFAGPGTVFPEWWGIDGTADNVQATAAYNSLTAGGTVVFSAAAYSFAANATMQSNTVTEIKPWTTITMDAAATSSILYALSETNIQITGGGTLDGNRANITGGDYAHGIFLNTCTNVRINGIRVKSAYKDNIYIYGCTNVRTIDSDIEDSKSNGMQIVSSVSVKIKGSLFKDNLNTSGTGDLLIYTGNKDVMVTENSFKAGGAEVTGQSHGVYASGSTGVSIFGNYFEDKYGFAIELQPAATSEAQVVFGNQIRNCGNATDETGGIYLSGESNIILGNFITESALDAIHAQGAEGSVIVGNIMTNSGSTGTDGYGIRFSGDLSDRSIIVANAIRDTQGTKTMKNALYLTAHPAIVIGNVLDETEDGYPYYDSADLDHILIGNKVGVRTSGYWQGDRGLNAQYAADLSGNATFDRNNFRIFLVAASGANRNLNPAGEWHAGDDVWIKNTGVSNNVIFDSSGLNQAIAPGEIGYFVYNALTSAWVKMYLGS